MTYDESAVLATNYFSKDPDSVLDYAINWSGDPDSDQPGPWLNDGDTIATSVWVVPDGLIKTNEDKTATLTTIWLSGGVLGKKYDVVNRITTAQGRTEDRTLHFTIEEH